MVLDFWPWRLDDQDQPMLVPEEHQQVEGEHQGYTDRFTV